MNIDTIIKILDACLYPEIQEGYDNSGPQIVFRERDITSMLISLDMDSCVFEEAVNKQCNLVVTHHPLLFNTIRRIDTGEQGSSLLVKLIDNRVSVYSAHTNLDKLFYDKLAMVIGFGTARLIYPHEQAPDGITAGFGAMVDLEEEVQLQEILARIKKSLGLEFVVYTGDYGKRVKHIALVNGAGGRSIQKIIRDTAVDCIITGDVSYHHAKYASDCGTAVIDAGHFGTERIMLSFLRDRVIDCLTNGEVTADIPIYISESERNPFRIYGAANE
ncbi:MAG TPA: Nif3-like dinuclear metal center hexameric protein [Spirochaetota bacterium]|nr:Nif3-like dinuclear metal center hexameric protein [Spirochaetota bacterium]HQJ69448.1 Nif3-like dinuclear metal center hexameric protein [Spirochaetota bacterium]HRS75548.1 Nif3-like dinuclear metal center hexameric protein [Spirochaetota bacterium]HRT75960.1 Nif3-like dinuclear metal center hexameric protein [Spirochaetota bacterium]